MLGHKATIQEGPILHPPFDMDSPRSYFDTETITTQPTFEDYLTEANVALRDAVYLENTGSLAMAAFAYDKARINLRNADGVSPLIEIHGPYGPELDIDQVPEVKKLYSECLYKLADSETLDEEEAEHYRFIADKTISLAKKLMADSELKRVEDMVHEVREAEAHENLETQVEAQNALAVTAVAAVASMELIGEEPPADLKEVVQEAIQTLEDTNPKLATVVELFANEPAQPEAETTLILSQALVDRANHTSFSLKLAA
jgi:hypothetical protein